MTNWGIQKVLLPDSDEEFSETAIVSGYGRTGNSDSKFDPRKLNWLEMKIVDDSFCESRGPFDRKRICMAHPDPHKQACKGDSGGPLVVVNSNGDHVVIGLVSHGYNTLCGNSEEIQFSVYTKVSRFIPWIQDTIRNHKDDYFDTLNNYFSMSNLMNYRSCYFR